MKKLLILLLILFIALLLWWLLYVRSSTTTFTGTILDPAGNPVAGATVEVGGQATTTDETGQFHIEGPAVGRERWVLEVRRPGYAPISKVLHQGLEDTVLTAVETTTVTLAAGAPMTARDLRTNCVGSQAFGAVWDTDPIARFPRVYDAGGNRLSGALPSAVRRVLDLLPNAQPCNSGVQVSIPANSLVGAAGQPVQGQVQIGLSTVDLLSPDGMPGDYSVSANGASAYASTVRLTSDTPDLNGGPLYMESLGAGTIEIRANNELLHLRKGSKAEIAIPVDRAQIDAGSTIPETIPLLRYDSGTGTWIVIGRANLDRARMVYIGEVEHLSEFNADVVKTNPACLRFDASGISGSFDLVTMAPTSAGGYRTFTHSIHANPAQTNPNLHAIYNLPANEWVVLRVIKGGTPVGTWIVQTGAAWGSTGAPSYPYTACGATAFALSEAVGTGIAHNGASHRFGPLAKHVAFLVDTSGTSEDVYPIGGTNCNSPCLYTFSLFDTGSNLVVIDNSTTPLMGLSMTPGPAWDVDVSINGLGSIGASLASPFGLPGTSGGAQAHSGVLRVAPRPLAIVEEETRTDGAGTPVGLPAVGVHYSLIGTPVANKVVARIDYTTNVTKGPWTFGANPFTITAPDVHFYQAGAAGIPSPTLTLFLEGFGSATGGGSGETGQRYFLQNVTLTNDPGTGIRTVFDNQSIASPVRFLFDTGTTYTVISSAMATQLGVTTAGMNPGHECSSLTPTNFATIDAIQFVGMNAGGNLATYTINNAEVCVDIGGSVITTHYPDPASPGGPALLVDAVIGSNLFDQASILWNGPRRTLGILP